MKELGDTATRWNAFLSHMMEKNEEEKEELLAEVERLREEIKDYDACLQNLWDKELIPEDTDIWDEVKELLEVD